MKAIDPEIDKLLKEQESKYFELVWYARMSPPYLNQDVADYVSDIEKRYPSEMEQLHSEETNWAHGFNSGCLAMVRLIMTSNDYESLFSCIDFDPKKWGVKKRIKAALEDFPFLDT